MAVSEVLTQIQTILNEVKEGLPINSSLPEFKGAEINLITSKDVGGSAGFIVGGSLSESKTTKLTLKLKPYIRLEKSLDISEVAKDIISAINAVDKNGSLLLQELVYEAGFTVTKNASGGFKINLIWARS